MKKQVSRAKSLFTALGKLGFGILFLIAVVAVQAQSPAPVNGEKETPLEVTYLGSQEDMVVFNVAYKNPSGNKFSIIVKDQDGSQLYQVVYNEKNFIKQFRLPRADRNKITFIIRNFKGADLTKTFAINVNSHYVSDVAVKKLD